MSMNFLILWQQTCFNKQVETPPTLACLMQAPFLTTWPMQVCNSLLSYTEKSQAKVAKNHFSDFIHLYLFTIDLKKRFDIR